MEGTGADIWNWDIASKKQKGYQLEKHDRCDFILEHMPYLGKITGYWIFSYQSSICSKGITFFPLFHHIKYDSKTYPTFYTAVSGFFLFAS
jgi:hypothetical protein